MKCHRGYWQQVLTMLTGFIACQFPQQLRRDAGLLWFTILVFFLTLISAFLAVQIYPQSIYLIYGKYQLVELTRAYRPDVMAMQPMQLNDIWNNIGFYLMNNGAVGLQLYIAGLLFGLGTLGLLVYSGLSLGMLMGYIHATGLGHVLWPSIISHSSLELLATIFCALAGFKLGWWLLQCLKVLQFVDTPAVARQTLSLVTVSTVLYALAACIEAAWSHHPGVQVWAKYITGVILWSLVFAYFIYVFRISKKASGNKA